MNRLRNLAAKATNSIPVPESHNFKLVILSGVAGGLAIITGALVLVGWAGDIERLKRILPGLVSMNPMTAVAFILAGISLWLQRRPPEITIHAPAFSSRRLAQFCALLVFCIGFVKLALYVAGWDSGVDQLLFAEKLHLDDAVFPNRMAPNTALNFIFLGLALLLVDVTTRRGRRPSEFFAIAIALLSLLALIGYAYQVKWLYGSAQFIPMALHTAAVFHLLALGILCARPGAGLMAFVMSESLGGALARRLFPGMVLILFVLGWLRIEGERLGFYGAELGVALYTIASITIFGALILSGARSLHRADMERRRTETERDRFFTLPIDLLCIAGTDGYFKRLNPAFGQTLGYTTDELQARPFLDFVHPADRAATLAEVAKLSQGEPTLEFENRYACKDGSWKWLSWRVQPFPSEGLLYASARDITGQKKAEAAIQQLNAELQERAGQLAIANKELESFSYSVSHDLRAPLRHIGGFAGKLQRHLGADRLDETGLRLLATIAESASNMGRLIDALLAFAKIGQAGLRRNRVSLDELVAENRHDLEREINGRPIAWEIAALPEVEGDPALLRQVFANLLGNAVKYTRHRPEARIEIGTQPGAEGEVIVFVRDNGAGFDMQYVGKLFGVFQRLHANTEFEGTGIGLANVRRIVERHGGRVWAEGAVDQGATFFFSLPVSKQ